MVFFSRSEEETARPLVRLLDAEVSNRAAFPRPRRERGSGGCKTTARFDLDLT
jgi:hypothetical protein